jgi:hypothetical protein
MLYSVNSLHNSGGQFDREQLLRDTHCFVILAQWPAREESPLLGCPRSGIPRAPDTRGNDKHFLRARAALPMTIYSSNF